MQFTYNGYVELINLLKEKDYKFCNYLNYYDEKKFVIFRHDVDMSLKKALYFAKLEYKNNIKSTYFVLVSTNFYNIFSKESNDILKEILMLGHDIGLHFDEKKYSISNAKELEYWVKKESKILEDVLDKKVNVVSMHRPSKWILNNDVQFKGMINSYSQKFFSECKYLSDSRMHWREDVLGIIRSGIYNKLHILTHPFWYSNKKETINYKLINFISEAKVARYYNLKNNIQDLDDIINEGELSYGNKIK